jgi:hypothetical protein
MAAVEAAFFIAAGDMETDRRQPTRCTRPRRSLDSGTDALSLSPVLSATCRSHNSPLQNPRLFSNLPMSRTGGEGAP